MGLLRHRDLYTQRIWVLAAALLLLGAEPEECPFKFRWPFGKEQRRAEDEEEGALIQFNNGVLAPTNCYRARLPPCKTYLSNGKM
ncbi:hypothetical protein B0T26DRAFT_694891 [Lasiosphaeria miniovina]|uniref:Uncharacterized protein n=1 Tax=Lasiosphaeria miniovina TaxID=1954250 RepID=A0AA40B4H6_9PEZI|nr:uncharacterized protein B0T26DRAFT_694891 [Lasiosphaeria miniovina]KAK0727540.1 hypothetical protein B0T26DRAFT_694891 [Lasiosphaeria miniovina]